MILTVQIYYSLHMHAYIGLKINVKKKKRHLTNLHGPNYGHPFQN